MSAAPYAACASGDVVCPACFGVPHSYRSVRGDHSTVLKNCRALKPSCPATWICATLSSVVCPLTHAPAKPGHVSPRAIEQFKLDYRVLPVRAQGWNGSPIQTGMPVTLISEL